MIDMIKLVKRRKDITECRGEGASEFSLILLIPGARGNPLYHGSSHRIPVPSYLVSRPPCIGPQNTTAGVPLLGISSGCCSLWWISESKFVFPKHLVGAYTPRLAQGGVSSDPHPLFRTPVHPSQILYIPKRNGAVGDMIVNPYSDILKGGTEAVLIQPLAA